MQEEGTSVRRLSAKSDQQCPGYQQTGIRFLVLEHKSFDLAELLRNNLTVVAMSAYENGVRFEGGVEASTIRHRYLIGSPVHLSRVLMNLSSNAIKYNHFHGTVNVHCEELSDDGNIAVFQFVCSDTGLGMSEEFQNMRLMLLRRKANSQLQHSVAPVWDFRLSKILLNGWVER